MNLDSKHGREVMEVLRNIAAQDHRAVLVVSHDQRIREVADRVLWLEDGRLRSIGKTVRDPVCHMGVDVEEAFSIRHDGRVFYFCSNGCGLEFQADPARYLTPEKA